MVEKMTEEVRQKRNGPPKHSETVELSDFRHQIQKAREEFPQLWESSRKYIAPEQYQEILPWLIEGIRYHAGESSWVQPVIEALLAFRKPQSSGQQCLHQQILKNLSGLPSSKAIRALIVWRFSQQARHNKSKTGELSPARLVELLQQSSNPYDLLFHVLTPSLLDIGAGDLTFEQELGGYYLGKRSPEQPGLILHAFDRLTPGSKVGGVYHRNRDRERALKSVSPKELLFRFWGDMGLEECSREKGMLSRYTMVTCHAPANPTFAYEPSRLTSDMIDRHLRRTRGDYHFGRFQGEHVLEVSHRGQILTFPDWKFEILGPLRLLEFICKNGAVGVLSAVDDEVFWEILSQLLADERYRPVNQILTLEIRRKVFGDLYERLQGLGSGDCIDLSTVAKLRTGLFHAPKGDCEGGESVRLAYVEIRRGAVLTGIPSSFTARQFGHMQEEAEPWWIILVPEFEVEKDEKL